MSDYRIRDYRSGDWPAIERLWHKTGLGGAHRGDDATVIERTLAHGGRFLILERSDTGEMIGTAWLTHDHRRSYLHHFGILPAYQGKKLSHLLMQAVMEAAREIGLQCKLEVHRENYKAIALYKKHGFTYLGDYDNYIVRKLG